MKRIIVGVKSWLVIGTLLVAGAGAAGSAAGNYRAHRPPPTTPPCLDGAKIERIGGNSASHTCADPSARLDVRILSGAGTDTTALFRCTCPRSDTPDAAARD